MRRPPIPRRWPRACGRRRRSSSGAAASSTCGTLNRHAGRAWHRRMYAGRWVGLRRPKEYGGREADSGHVGVDPVLLELLPEGIAVDAEELGGADLIALGLAHDSTEQRLLDQADHEG